VSASAEVHISVAGYGDREKITEIIEQELANVGFDTTPSREYSVWYGEFGWMFDARSYGCSWDVLEDYWAKGLVSLIYDADPSLSVDVYVYNLDREADVVASTPHDARKEETHV